MDKAELRQAERGTGYLDRRDTTRHLKIHLPCCEVSVRPSAFLGFLSGNPARRVVDLSECDVAVEVSRQLQRGARVRVRLRIGRYEETFEADALVRACPMEAGSFVAYLEFTRVPGDLRSCIREMVRNVKKSA